MENPLCCLKTPGLRLRNYFSKEKVDTGFEMSFVGTRYTSSYTQSREAGNHSTRLARACSDIYSNPVLQASKFLVGSATTAAVAG